MPKVVIHIFHADAASLSSASHLSERIRQVKADKGVELEVYVFGPAENAMADGKNEEFNREIDALACEGVPVHTCITIAEGLAASEAFRSRGIELEYARDAFIRFALEGATVVTF